MFRIKPLLVYSKNFRCIFVCSVVLLLPLAVSGTCRPIIDVCGPVVQTLPPMRRVGPVRAACRPIRQAPVRVAHLPTPCGATYKRTILCGGRPVSFNDFRLRLTIVLDSRPARRPNTRRTGRVAQ